MSKLKYNKPTKNATPKHIEKHHYVKATRKQLKMLRDLGIKFDHRISSFSAHCLISKALGKDI